MFAHRIIYPFHPSVVLTGKELALTFVTGARTVQYVVWHGDKNKNKKPACFQNFLKVGSVLHCPVACLPAGVDQITNTQFCCTIILFGIMRFTFAV
jgi:hypothetical protein